MMKSCIAKIRKGDKLRVDYHPDRGISRWPNGIEKDFEVIDIIRSYYEPGAYLYCLGSNEGIPGFYSTAGYHHKYEFYFNLISTDRINKIIKNKSGILNSK